MSDQHDPEFVRSLLRQLGFGAPKPPVRAEQPEPVTVVESDEVILVDDVRDPTWWQRAHTVTTVRDPSGSVSLKVQAVAGTFSGDCHGGF